MISALKQAQSARIFALLALLLVAGMQSVEVAHGHFEPSEEVECLVCDTCSLLAVTTPAVTPLSVFQAATTGSDTTLAAYQALTRHYDGRAPPHFS
ncbi:hypothetical protein BST95_01830 [Halioglobus japonicus]|uniref:Uncharacterized protein n=1 Tax=Halioglobus japonicus TaxID=930805 RepID=A0AAP8MCF5_9GAMM|nr:hypothetical protein [Halioglobus japonicus]AQA17142.1 hypothetical protein BST95_01830 [Halioglobus japonicus]PLW85054.1 hypothetical protein C0029_16095 [Halioglobus japonicus]GHD19225.1 hypothetical protein GCM10007052_27430 [Halioglobus japonicus]